MRASSMKLALAATSLMTILFVAACGSSSSVSPTSPSPSPSPAPAPGGPVADVTITIANLAFAPSSMTVKVGQKVAWQNSDSVTHTATANSGAFDTGAIAPRSTSAPITMATAGTFQYHCTIHPFMVATLVVQ